MCLFIMLNQFIMKKLVFLSIFSLFFVFAHEANAQGLLKRIANKAKQTVEEKIEKKADKKIEEEVDKKIDKALENEGEEEKETKNQGEKRGMEALRGIMNQAGFDSTPIEVEDSYTFTSNIKMYIETYEDNGKLESKGYFNSFFNKSTKTFAYEMIGENENSTDKAFMIYDQEKNASIILSEKNGEKSGLVTGINFGLTQADYEDMQEVDGQNLTYLNENIKKTGRTKNILGYKCSEYKYKDEEVESTVWMTKEKVWQVNNMLSTIYKSARYSHGFPAGFMMEMESNNLDTKEKSIMKVTEVNDDIKKTVELSGYELVNMGSLNLDGME